MIRNPVDRAISHYHMQSKLECFDRIDVNESLRRAIEYSKDRENDEILEWMYDDWDIDIYNLSDEMMDAWRYRDYIKPGLYYEVINAYNRTFGKNNVHVIVFDDFIKDTKKEMERLLSFLELEMEHDIDYTIKSNSKRSCRNVFIRKALNNRRLVHFLKAHMNIQTGHKLKTWINRLNEKSHDDIRVDEETRKYLLDYYRSDIIKVSELIEYDLSDWLRI